MKIFTKDNAYAAIFSAFVLAGLALASSHVTHAESAVRLTRSSSASALVSAMPEAHMLTARQIPQISVLCEQDKPASGFHVQIGYWQAGQSKTVQTNEPCAYWGQVMSMLPEKGGWQVNLADSALPITYENVVLAVATDSAGHSH
jgi:hypothetical protein